ncbi:group I intron-associated PD-(D/E)XK endonuclease [Halobaculum sp. CBA1158]|uniref:group I intron-associated PD-(D/E)XK endonuclease n=1 Tax=Halobaculum sp. CBA1158 TaxID=2904243 RepID=UPI001F3B55A3|nr:group I intron-associated PD-(D/E)XK endonuclease [Halobaculum sp. CBA1158]UIP00189.1 group I intron-associated PD-(D/E)XK endonuclease [Halobaculum sp. CBA1158]
MQPLHEMPSHRKGDYTEAIVVAELKRRGVRVARPVGDNERYDLVVAAESGFYSVQVKTGLLMDGCVYVRGKSQHTNATGNTYRDYDGDVDLFLVYCHDLETMYLVREDAFGTGMYLRVDEPEQRDRTINWAAEYEFDRNWPPSSATRPCDDGLRVTRKLEERDVLVHRSTTDRSYDLLLETPDGAYHRTTVTPGYLNDGRVRFDGKGAILPDDTDLVLVDCDDLDTLYLVRRDEYDAAISLRVDPPAKPNSRINWAEDYEFDARWPDDITE